jgi:hypothetical protein
MNVAVVAAVVKPDTDTEVLVREKIVEASALWQRVIRKLFALIQDSNWPEFQPLDKRIDRLIIAKSGDLFLEDLRQCAVEFKV